MKRNRIFRFILIGLAGIAVSCERGGDLRRDDLFTINLGILPDQLDWFYRESFRIAATADIQSLNGQVYISGSESGKIMVFSSYGDLLTYIFDDERNPEPLLNDRGESGYSFSQWPLRDPAAIAVQDGVILVEDTVLTNRRAQDNNLESLYDRIILRFDLQGNYLGHLGREGLGGSPFPEIWSLDVRKDNGIVITTHSETVWTSYWYDNEGSLITTLEIDEKQLSDLSDEDLPVSVYSVRPDPVKWAVHVRLDRYVRTGNTNEPEALLYTLNLNKPEYSEPVVLIYSQGNSEQDFPAVPPEHLGTTLEGMHLMLSPEGAAEYRLSLVDDEGKINQYKLIRVNPGATVYRRFRVNRNGILMGIFFTEDKAYVSRWRTDKLLGRD